jgi:hypothetical protein
MTRKSYVSVVSRKKNKRSESPAAFKKAPPPPAAELIVVDNPEEANEDAIVEIGSQVDLSNTGNFGGYTNNELAEARLSWTLTKTSLPIFWQMTPLNFLLEESHCTHILHIASEKSELNKAVASLLVHAKIMKLVCMPTKSFNYF